MSKKQNHSNSIIDLIQKTYISIRNRLIILNSKRWSYFSFDFSARIPNLVLHEKFQPYVTWSIRIIIFLGIVLSFLSLSLLLSVSTTICLLIFERILERIVFKYTTIFVQPIPEYEEGSWIGMIYLIPMVDNFWKIGLLFKDKELAEKIFSCIRSWNYFEKIDSKNNIHITFVIENDAEEYSVYVYPSFERETVIKAKQTVDPHLTKDGRKMEQHQLVVTIVLCRRFPNSQESHFQKFLSRYNPNELFEFGVYAIERDIPEFHGTDSFFPPQGTVSQIDGELSILKKHVKIVRREDLTANDIEYQHGRLSMELL